MPTLQEKQRQEILDQGRRELRRKSLDQLKVYNPLSEPFKTQYEGFFHVCLARDEATFPRYIAEKWMREWITDMINKDEQAAVDKENDRRVKKGWLPLSPEERDQFDIRSKLLTSNEETRVKYMRMVYRGIDKEHGLDVPDQQAPTRVDRRPMDEKILEQLDAEMGIVHEVSETADLEDKKEDFVKEVAGEGEG